MDLPFVVFGASGHGQIVVDLAHTAGLHVEYVLDDTPKVSTLLGVPVREATADFLSRFNGFRFIVAIGDNVSRRQIFNRLCLSGGRPAILIHPFSSISAGANLCDGTVVCAGVVVNTGAAIAENCIINTGASIDHGCAIAAHTHICPGVHLAGDVTVGEESMIGIGSAVIPGINIGFGSVVGAGSVVTKDLPSRVVAFGNPARIIRTIAPSGIDH